MYDLEPSPPNPAELREDYQQTLLSLADNLESSPYIVVQIGEGVSIHAAQMPAYREYGAENGDDKMVLIVVKTEDQSTAATTYDLTVLHFSETLSRQPTWKCEVTYQTDFQDDELDGYDTELADQVRRMLEAAHEFDRFDYEEAKYWANCYFESPTMRASLNGQRRSERRTRRALVDLLVHEIYAEQLRNNPAV